MNNFHFSNETEKKYALACLEFAKIIGKYIVDFYCAKARLVVELDGGGHYDPEKEEKDRTRTEILEKYGLKVLRFCNLDIDNNLYGVCTMIDREVKERMKGG